MRTLSRNPHRLLVALTATLAAIGLFGGGAIVGNALDDDSSGDQPPASAAVAGPNGTGIAIGAPSMGTPGGNDAASGEGRGDAGVAYPGYVCNVPIPAVLKDGQIDPALAGFAAKYLSAGFELTGFSIRGQSAECDGGTPTGKVTIAVDTQWRHRDSGLAVYVSQAQDDRAMAAVLEEVSARFSKAGYFFNVNVQGYAVQPLADDKSAADAPLVPGADPRAKEVLRAALADLGAPAEACFYVARAGTWEDVIAAGIGDPRSAIPSNFTVQDFNVQAWTPPAAGCDSAGGGVGINFSASWVYNGTERQFSGLYIGASAVEPGSEKYPGYIGQYGANWSNGTFWFNVGYKIDPSQGGDLGSLDAIARLLDPNYVNACAMREQQLTESEMAALGVKSPTASGYTRKATELVSTELSGDCAGYRQDGGMEPQTRAHWQLRDGAATIDVNAYKFAGSGAPEKAQGWISDNSISWTAGSVSYNVSGWAESGDPPSRDKLIEVAKSMDPSFDPSTLSEQPGGGVPGKPPVQPAIAEDTRR